MFEKRIIIYCVALTYTQNRCSMIVIIKHRQYYRISPISNKLYSTDDMLPGFTYRITRGFHSDVTGRKIPTKYVIRRVHLRQTMTSELRVSVHRRSQHAISCATEPSCLRGHEVTPRADSPAVFCVFQLCFCLHCCGVTQLIPWPVADFWFPGSNPGPLAFRFITLGDCLAHLAQRCVRRWP